MGRCTAPPFVEKLQQLGQRERSNSSNLPILVQLLSTLLLLLLLDPPCRVSPAKCLCDSGDCRAFVRLERCHSRISVLTCDWEACSEFLNANNCKKFLT